MECPASSSVSLCGVCLRGDVEVVFLCVCGGGVIVVVDWLVDFFSFFF